MDELRVLLKEDLKNLGINFETNLGEQLDSLDRLEIITKFEEMYETDFTRVLTNPRAWESFNCLVEYFIKEI